ncbi:MAG: DsbA family protein [Solirubrobacteraceae bacterium]
MMDGAEPTFYYDTSSPYAYLAALRVDRVVPVAVRWQPIVFGALLRASGRVPWSLTDGQREPGQRVVQQRARKRGLAPVRWPEGWPADSYSLLPLRAIVWAQRARGAESAKALTLQLYETQFAQGRALDDVYAVLDSGARCGLDGEELLRGMELEDVKQALRVATDEAIALGVEGVPTVAVGGRLLWGDDRLEQAASATAGG